MSNALALLGCKTDDRHVDEVVRSAKQELQALLAQRAEITRQIGTIKQTLAGLAALFGDHIFDAEVLEWLGRKAPRRGRGFTQACRHVLMEATEPLSTKEICARMRAKFPAIIEAHKDAVASVTTVLTRLVSYREAERIVNDHGRPKWQWIAGAQPSGALATQFPSGIGRPATHEESATLAARQWPS